MESSIKNARDDEKKAHQMANNLLSEMEEMRAVSQCEKDFLLHSLEKVRADWIEGRRQQVAIDLFKN